MRLTQILKRAQHCVQHQWGMGTGSFTKGRGTQYEYKSKDKQITRIIEQFMRPTANGTSEAGPFGLGEWRSGTIWDLWEPKATQDVQVQKPIILFPEIKNTEVIVKFSVSEIIIFICDRFFGTKPKKMKLFIGKPDS